MPILIYLQIFTLNFIHIGMTWQCLGSGKGSFKPVPGKSGFSPWQFSGFGLTNPLMESQRPPKASQFLFSYLPKATKCSGSVNLAPFVPCSVWRPLSFNTPFKAELCTVPLGKSRNRSGLFLHGWIQADIILWKGCTVQITLKDAFEEGHIAGFTAEKQFCLILKPVFYF